MLYSYTPHKVDHEHAMRYARAVALERHTVDEDLEMATQRLAVLASVAQRTYSLLMRTLTHQGCAHGRRHRRRTHCTGER